MEFPVEEDKFPLGRTSSPLERRWVKYEGVAADAFLVLIESERERLKPFRRALNKEDQEAFDRLFDWAKMHTWPGVYMANPWPMETILLSICLEQGKLIEEILAKFKSR